MKAFGFLFVLLLLIGTASFLYLGYSYNGSTALNPGMVSTGSRNAVALIMRRRKLEGNLDFLKKDEDDGGTINLDDYRPIDPVPSSTASIKPGPIQHGTPLMPYIPEPSPPPSEAEHDDKLNK